MGIKNAKIGLVSAQSFSEPGGVQNHVISLYDELKKLGHNCKIISPGKHKPSGVREDDVIPIGVSMHVPANGSQTDMSISLRRNGRERIRHENFDILHFHNLSLGPLSLQILRNSSALHILTLHAADDGSTLFKFFPLLKSVVGSIYEKKFHGVIGVSTASYKTFDGYYNNGPLKIIPNGIDLKKFSPDIEKISEFQDGKRNILFVGRFEKRKGLLFFLKACDWLVNTQGRQNLRFIIVGDGEERNEAENFVHERGLYNHVRFVGRVEDRALPSYYKTADIFCAPSIYGESFGITLLEAMASGTPIVGFSNPGYSLLMHGHKQAIGADLLSVPGDFLSLARKIEMLLDNKNLYERSKKWGISRCQEFPWPKVADQVIKFYEEAWNAREAKLRLPERRELHLSR